LNLHPSNPTIGDGKVSCSAMHPRVFINDKVTLPVVLLPSQIVSSSLLFATVTNFDIVTNYRCCWPCHKFRHSLCHLVILKSINLKPSSATALDPPKDVP
jgi:hypothetical protein